MSESTTIIGRECRFAIHIPTRSRDFKDMHLVKENVHFADGHQERQVRLVEDYPRTFYVTKKPYQNHTQKKESEEIDKLTKYTCTQSDMRFHVSRALGKGYSSLQMDQLAASPFLYGSDVSSTTLIKQAYRQKYPDLATSFSVATFDIETDVVHGTDDPILATIVMQGKLFHVAIESYLKGYANPEEKYRTVLRKHLGHKIDQYQFEVEFEIVKTPVDLIRVVLAKLHLWQPDLVAIWNIGFDIPRLLDTLKKYGIAPEPIFCDPSVPIEMRYCKYKKGSTKKITASGAVKPKNPSEQWHSLLCPAGFWFIDQMSTYRFIRQGAQEEQDYSLNAILEKVLGVRKLEFEEAKHLKTGSLEWHRFMQINYPFEYMAYNNFDSIGTYELDLETKDLLQAMPTACEPTDFTRFDSQTKRFADGYYFYLLEKGHVIGTIPPRPKKDDNPWEEEAADFIGDSEDEFDENGGEDDEESDELNVSSKDEVLSIKGIIVTLKAHMSSLGLPLVDEIKDLKTMIRCYTYDSDATAAYPSATAVSNASRATTLNEIIDIQGVDEAVFRKNNLNLFHGGVNSVEYCVEMFKLPDLSTSLQSFMDESCHA